MKLYVFKINDDHVTVKVPAESMGSAQHKLLTAQIDGHYLVEDNKFTLIHEEEMSNA